MCTERKDLTWADYLIKENMTAVKKFYPIGIYFIAGDKYHVWGEKKSLARGSRWLVDISPCLTICLLFPSFFLFLLVVTNITSGVKKKRSPRGSHWLADILPLQLF